MNKLGKKNNWAAYLFIYSAADAPVLCTDLLLYYKDSADKLHRLEWNVGYHEFCGA
ncbi:MAG: hypothetical protein Q4C91_09640 [Eubacteriales bacterium]|nr:hypothetical protein [Eubacteriales bacterium]